MKKLLLCSSLLVVLSCGPLWGHTQNVDSTIIRNLFTEALNRGECYQNLEVLCKSIGSRLSGSPEAEKAVAWAEQLMKDAGMDKVWLQEVMVPHWVRGKKERAQIKSVNMRQSKDVPVCALGGSVGTGLSGLRAKVVEVQSFEELDSLGKEALKGKVVFFNRPMNPDHIHTFHAYGGAVDQRTQGALQAAKYGAVATIVRSMTLANDDFAHTGAMRYEEDGKKIPAAAISTKGADLLHDWLQKDPDLEFFLQMNCETLPDVKSYNVIGEIKGSKFPDEIILTAGHLDSWDMGDGAHDDGAGCVQALEALRLFKALEIEPERTLRVVFYMNEENGLKGGIKYAEVAEKKKENHLVGIESDAGGFTPRGFSINADTAQIEAIQTWKPLLAPYGLHDIQGGWGGADISPLKNQGTILVGFMPDSQRYFDYHHSNNDTFDKVNRRELEMGAASMAALTYLLAKFGINKEEQPKEQTQPEPTSK